MKLVFFGTPEFAVSSLVQLIHSDHDIKAVVSTPDSRSGRGLESNSSPIKKTVINRITNWI